MRRERGSEKCPEGALKFAELQRHFNHYIAQTGSGGRSLGQELLAHSHAYNRWRFFNIRRNEEAKKKGQAGPDATTAAEREHGFAAERARMQRVVAPLKRESETAEANQQRSEERVRAARIVQARTGQPVSDNLLREQAIAQEAAARTKDRYLTEKAKLDTYADDSALPANLAAYDARLIKDAREILATMKQDPTLKLRPHYQNLISAYRDEFEHNQGLRDEKVIAFFDRYVHDSLAGFAMDATLPSDPRVAYTGGDNKLRFAGLASPRIETQAA